jgi:hypothetical protein
MGGAVELSGNQLRLPEPSLYETANYLADPDFLVFSF